MINPITNKNFLLNSSLAEKLYYDYASELPIIDYHCHLSPKDLATNKKYNDITEIWLDGDHYKWRAMRANGVSEKYITGNTPSYEKFMKWAETVPYTLRNPLYHWTHLELYKVFGINDLLNTSSAKEIYENTSSQLNKSLDTYAILKKFNVEYICTTDDPIDDLKWHKTIKEKQIGVKIIPAWRPDKALAVNDVDAFNDYINKLSSIENQAITNYKDFLEVLKNRHDYFHLNGCRLSDHGLEFPFPIENSTKKEVVNIFEKLRLKKTISSLEIEKFRAVVLHEFALWNFEKGWVQQFHVGALRDVNTEGVKNVGQACGYDSIADFNYAKSMGQFFDMLQKKQKLTKTIVYNLNPRDNETVATMLGNFQDGHIPGKMQYGAAWWFLDQKDGITKHINTISNHGLLSRFIGMLTDSRSLLSYSRHEYFRRILCNILAEDVINGEIPNDEVLLGTMIEGICYKNAKNYFSIN